ncbi:MAG: glycosyltransferase family 39 protein [Bacteroidales bacterium]|nr:glycosyltransferase family 39 protein [Bacteroidales bacterium]
MILPFEWDEMGVYVPAAFLMKDTGHIGLLPSCLEPLFSRGHPLLFTFITALVFKLFGETVLAGHIYAMSVTVLTVVVFFLFARKEFNPLTAFFASILLMIQPTFYTMSVIVLPEMMLTLFSILSVWGIVRHRWILYAVSSSLAIMTKESAIVIPAVAMLVLFIEALSKRELFSLKSIKLFSLSLVPLLVFGLFLIVQKIQNGWYLFPEHIGYIHFTWDTIYPIGQRILNEMFINFGKWPTGVSFLAGIVLCIFRKQLKIPLNANAIMVFSLFVLFVFLFAVFNYYLTRYILYGIPFIILGGVHTFFKVTERIVPRFRFMGPVLVTALAAFFGVIKGYPDMYRFPFGDMSYTSTIKITKDAISWAEKQPWRNDTIEANFPVYQALKDKRNGYLSGDPLPVSGNFQKKTRYGLIFYTWEPDNIPNWKNYKYTILKTWSEGFVNIAWVEYEHDSTPSAVNGSSVR